MDESTLFSQINTILKIHSTFVEQILFHFFQILKPILTLFRQILIGPKCDKMFYSIQEQSSTSTRLSRRRPYMNTYTRHTPIWVSDRPTGSVVMLQLNSVLCLYLAISISIMFQSKLIIKFQYMYTVYSCISVTKKISVNFGNFKN